jgi:uncharacterized protein YdaU (DUF1376 family)
MAKEIKPYYVDWDPGEALKGTEILEPLEELAYRRIIDLIYATNDALPDDEKRLARMTKTGKSWKKIRLTLIELDKIQIVNGFIRNKKCTSELAAARQRIEQNSRAGKISAEKRKSLKNQETASTDVITDVPTDEHTSVPTSEPTNYQITNLPIKEDVVVVTRARDHVDVGKQIAAIVGWDKDPRWFGDYGRVEVWLQQGWDPEQDILPTVRRLMANRKSHPKTMKYFEQAIADAHASRISPAPKGNPHETTSPRKTKSDIADDALAEFLAGRGIAPPGGNRADSPDGAAVLRPVQQLREGSQSAEINPAGVRGSTGALPD